MTKGTDEIFAPDISIDNKDKNGITREVEELHQIGKSCECDKKLVDIVEGEKEAYFFEGVEKELELWFFTTSAVGEIDGASLRQIPYSELEAMLELAQCRILHSRSNALMDSYLLSESSMFVSDNRIILKTCGSTRLLETVPRIVELAEQYAGMSHINNIYYSRKNYLRPELQPKIHKTFDLEVDELNKHFSGFAFCLGSMLDDRWFLYTNGPESPPNRPDQTMELQMTHLPNDVLRYFSKAECQSGQECTRRARIHDLVPKGTMIHEELFDPVGYSMNGIISETDEYVTIHITPEPAFSYVSFETNNSNGCFYNEALKVITCFKPGRFILTLVANEFSDKGKNGQMKFWHKKILGYRRANLQFLHLEYDTVMFASYERMDDDNM